MDNLILCWNKLYSLLLVFHFMTILISVFISVYMYVKCCSLFLNLHYFLPHGPMTFWVSLNRLKLSQSQCTHLHYNHWSLWWTKNTYFGIQDRMAYSPDWVQLYSIQFMIYLGGIQQFEDHFNCPSSVSEIFFYFHLMPQSKCCFFDKLWTQFAFNTSTFPW